jgi:hypothetical protein
MKNFFIAAISMAMVSSAFAQNQPQGTWYLGTTNNATDVLNIFSNGVQSMSPTIGYAVADNFVVSLSLTASRSDVSLTDGDAVTYLEDIYVISQLSGDTLETYLDVETTVEAAWTNTVETRSTGLNLGVQYFFGDNYFVGAGLGAGNTTVTSSIGALGEFGDLTYTDSEVESRHNDFSLTVGKFIPVRENWYLTPQAGYMTRTMEDAGIDSDSGEFAFSIGFGARF